MFLYRASALWGLLGSLGASWVLLEPLGAEIPDHHLDRLQDAQDAWKSRPGRPDRLPRPLGCPDRPPGRLNRPLRPPQLLERPPGMLLSTLLLSTKHHLVAMSNEPQAVQRSSQAAQTGAPSSQAAQTSCPCRHGQPPGMLSPQHGSCRQNTAPVDIASVDNILPLSTRTTSRIASIATTWLLSTKLCSCRQNIAPVGIASLDNTRLGQPPGLLLWTDQPLRRGKLPPRTKHGFHVGSVFKLPGKTRSLQNFGCMPIDEKSKW